MLVRNSGFSGLCCTASSLTLIAASNSPLCAYTLLSIVNVESWGWISFARLKLSIALQHKNKFVFLRSKILFHATETSGHNLFPVHMNPIGFMKPRSDTMISGH